MIAILTLASSLAWHLQVVPTLEQKVQHRHKIYIYAPIVLAVAKQTLTSSNCAGGYCGTLTQDTSGSNPTIYAWNMGTTNVNNIYDWCAYIPS